MVLKDYFAKFKLYVKILSVKMTPWKNAPDGINKHAGFVYKIRNKLTGQEYIGKKFFWTIQYRNVPGRVRRKRIKKESDWRYYISSSKDVQKDIHRLGYDNFEFIILQCYPTRAQVNYAEVEFQVREEVLTARLPDGSWKYYNKNIMRKFYKRQA